ncbi:MAG: tannase/feruloyl esterase family alpha/beta hydrolase [Lautropia sp.]
MTDDIRTTGLARCAVGIMIAVIAGGCASSSPTAPSARSLQAPLTMIAPRSTCESMVARTIDASSIGLPTRGARVTAAETIAPAGPSVDADRKRSTLALPGYCKVLFEIDPVDPKAPPIKAQVNLPARWKQASLQVGGGGLNGSIPRNLAAIGPGGSPIGSVNPPDSPYPLTRGYATFGGDSGHQGDAGDWALNDEAWLNFGHASLKKTRDAAHAIIALYYGERPRVGYFMGTSQGGREALEVAQRYPDDYDGIVAHVPLIGYSAHVIHKTLLARAQANGEWISPEQAQRIGAEVLRQCDALDGLRDGVIDAYLACNARFDGANTPQALAPIRCAAGATDGTHCLSDAQIAVVAQMHAPTRFGFALANGLDSFPGYGTGREGLTGLNMKPEPKRPARPNLGQPGTTVQYGIIKDPALNLLDFTIDAYRARIVAASAIIDSTNPDLSRFFARGGRLIIRSSASDYFVNPRTLWRYVETIEARFGKDTVDRHVRLYVLPNGSHAGQSVSGLDGRTIPHHVDLIGMATDWVENGIVPPDAPVLRAMSPLPPFDVTATRPMCRYPLYPRYIGSGDPSRAEHFRCTQP